jgi:hypothetical protein
MNKITIAIVGVLSAASAAYFFSRPSSVESAQPTDVIEHRLEQRVNDVSASGSTATLTQTVTECNVTQKVEMEALLRRFMTEESIIRTQIFRIIKDLHIEPYKKELFLQSLRVPFSIDDYRKQTSWHKDFSFSDLPPVEGKLDIIPVSDSIHLSLLLKEQNLQQLAKFIQDKKITSHSVADGLSILSNILKMEQQIDVGWLKSLTDLGLQPNIADIRTAIDLGYPTEVILFLFGKSEGSSSKLWYQDYAKFNILTYAASKAQYEVALQLYKNYGVALSVKHDYTVLDFINYSAITGNVYAAELIEVALKEKVTPYNSKNILAIKNYLKDQGSSHLKELSGYMSLSTNELTINHIDDPKFTSEKRQRFSQLMDRIFVLQGEIKLLTDSLTHCAVKNAAVTDHSKTDTRPIVINPQVNTSQTSKVTSDPIRQATTEEAILMKEVALAIGEAESGNFDEALTIIDRIANQTGDKALYTGFISIAVNANYPVELIHKALNKGGELPKSTIFTFITNSNLDGIELYKFHHDIHLVKDLKGRTPLEFALQRKSNEKVTSKLK